MSKCSRCGNDDSLLKVDTPSKKEDMEAFGHYWFVDKYKQPDYVKVYESKIWQAALEYERKRVGEK
jgi:hypothetical protein